MTDIEKGALWWYRSGTGGGALLDYCSYGACLARWYIGEGAVAVQGIAANLGSPYGGVEDNAVITVRFPKALAILEATWNCVDHGIPTGPVLYGSEGTLVVDREFGKPGGVYVHRGHGRTPEYVAGDPLPVGRETLAREVFTHLETGQPVHLTLDADFNLEAMAILDSGIRSVKSGKQELVDDARWRVG